MRRAMAIGFAPRRSGGKRVRRSAPAPNRSKKVGVLRLTTTAASLATCVVLLSASPELAKGATSAGVGRVPQATQADTSYAVGNRAVPNTFVTTQQTSCYRPEVPAIQFNFGPIEG